MGYAHNKLIHTYLTRLYCFYRAISSTEYPDYNVEMDLDVMKNPKHTETTLDLHYGEDAKDMKKRILISQELDVTGNTKNLNVDHVAKLKWKAMVSVESKLIQNFLYS